MATPTIIFNTKLNQQGALRDAKSLRDSLGKPIDIKLNARSLAQPLGRITGDVAEFTKSLQAATARVTAFGATSGGIIAVSQAISQVAKSVIEVDKQLIELNTFLGQSQSKLQSVGDSLFKIAKDTASSFADTAEAAKEFARQGLSVEETLKRTNDALVLSRISGLGAADSVNALTTAINSFNKSGLDSAEIVNKLVKVDSNFAVSAADLAQALTRVGSAAQDSGVGFEELIAVVTTAQQTTGRGGAIIGNALKTIFTRLKRPEVLDQLQQLGVAVKDQNGALLSGTQILTNYISATKNLGQVEKARNDELLGGVYQINQLKAITNDLAKSNGIYARSLAIANSATDDATKKNQELNKSLSAIIQNTKTNFEKRGGSIGEPIIKPLVKRAAGLGNFLLDNLGVDKSSAGKEGQDLGNTFAQSFFKGIGEAASGPGLVLIGALAINIGKRLVSFVSDASKVLLNINSTAANTQAIEQAINNTLAQQPKITQAIISGQITREQAAAQLLKVFTMQNQQLMLQKGLSSSLAQTFSKGGYVASPELGIYKAAKRKAGGYIPNFAAEKREAMSYGADPSVQPYMTEAVINGTPQVVTVNTGETVIPKYKGGVDTAIIPNYAKGNIPNFAGKQFTINSSAGFRKLIIGNKQKFLSVKYKTENGIIENFDAKNYVMQSGIAVRPDEYVGAAPPKPFKTWKEFREARNTISLRNPTSGDRKTFRADRILEVNAGGNKFVPSASLQKANELTSPFNSKTLRGMGVENLTNASGALSKNFKNASFEEIQGSMAAARMAARNTRLASGYIPNFAGGTGRYYAQASRSGAAGRGPSTPDINPNQKSAFESSIGSAVTSAIYFALPSIATGFANENNQEAIAGSLKAAAAINVLAAAINGFSKGGTKGAVTGALGASVTSGVLLSQASQVKTGVTEQVFEKARDKAANGFNKLTENISDLTQTISDLESQYADPNARPDALIKLAKKEQDLLRKISLNNPEAAALYKSAGSPEEKQRALATAKDTAQKEASISKTVLDFAELDTAKRDAKAITSFFSELAGQLDTEKVDIKNLNTSNFNDFLNRGGIGKTSSVFSGGKGGEDLTKYFIDFLKAQEKRVTLNKEAESLISEIKKPLIELQSSIESSQAVRGASREARGGYLESMSRFSGNFGERAAIESKAAIDRYNLNRNEKQTFFSRVSSESKDLASPALRSLVQSITSKGPSKDASDSIKSLIADLKKSNPQSKDIDKLQRISTQILTGIKKAGTFDKIIEAQSKFALKALTPQERLSFGGGIKTSIDASSKIDAFKNTQRGALQYQLGSMFGSKETQIGGLANFATNLKEKYAGLFEGEAGKNAFGGVADQLTQLRAFDIRQSLAKDAMTARNIGQFGLAGELENKLNPMNQGEIYKTARLQAEQQLGLTPKGLIDESLSEADRAEALDRQAKASEDQQIRGVEKALAPSIDAITYSFVTQINQLQEPLNAAIQNAFGKGMEISNATLIAKNLDLGSILGGKGNQSKPEQGDVPAPTREEVLANREEVRARSGFAGGFIPNFSSPLLDAVNREVSAGYSPSQVRIGQSSSLTTPFNPSGFGVFNSTEGSLGNGMSLARSSGINPATKGMANGFIPNFAKKIKGLVNESENEPSLKEFSTAKESASTMPSIEEDIPSGDELKKLKKTIRLGTYEPKVQIMSDDELFNRYKQSSSETQTKAVEAKIEQTIKKKVAEITKNSPKKNAASKKAEAVKPYSYGESVGNLMQQSALARSAAFASITVAEQKINEGKPTEITKGNVQSAEKIGIVEETKKKISEKKQVRSLLQQEREERRAEKLKEEELKKTEKSRKEAEKAAEALRKDEARKARAAANLAEYEANQRAKLTIREKLKTEKQISQAKQASFRLPKNPSTIFPRFDGFSGGSAGGFGGSVGGFEELSTERSADMFLRTAAPSEVMNDLSVKKGAFGSSLSGAIRATFNSSATGLPGAGNLFGRGGSGGSGGVPLTPLAGKPSRLALPAPGQTTEIGPWIDFTVGTQQRFVSEGGGPLKAEFRNTASLNQTESEKTTETLQSQKEKRDLLNKASRDTRRESRLQNAPSGKFGEARRALYEYNRNQESQSTSSLIKSILLDQSGLSRTAIKAATGLWPEQVQNLTPSSLESLLRKRNIVIDRKNIGAYNGEEGKLLTDIDFTKAKLTPEEVIEIEKGAKQANTSKRFIVDPSGNIVEQLTNTQLRDSAKLKYPDPMQPKATSSLGSFSFKNGQWSRKIGDLKDKKGFLGRQLSGARNFGGNILNSLRQQDLKSLTGYVSKADINQRAKQLLDLESKLFDSKASQQVKDAILNDFLKSQGLYAPEVEARSGDLFSRRKSASSISEIRKKYSNALNQETGKATFNNKTVQLDNLALYNSITKDIAEAVRQGRLTPEQAAKAQRKIYLDDLKMSPSQYVDMLKTRNVTPSSVEEFYKSGSTESSLREDLKARNSASDLEQAQKEINKIGVKINPETGIPEPSLEKGGSWRSYSKYRLDKIAEINTNPTLSRQQKESSIEKLKRETLNQETIAKRRYARDRGLEYNPQTDQVGYKGSSKEIAASEAAARASAESVSNGAKAKALTGFGVVGAGYGLFSAYEAFKQGDAVEGILSGVGGVASIPQELLSKIPFLKSLGGKSPEAAQKMSGILGKVGGAAFGTLGALSYGKEAISEFNPEVGQKGSMGRGAFAGLQAATSAGAGFTSAIGQKIMSQRLFGVGAILELGNTISRAKNGQLVNARTGQGRILEALTGSSFEDRAYMTDEEKTQETQAAIGDVL